MLLLLDTHALVWSLTSRSRFSAEVLDSISDVGNDVWVSAISAYEIEYKRPRDPELQKMPADLDDAVRRQGLSWLPMTATHGATAARLPLHHPDPWDRILVAQAMLEGMTLVTIDRKLSRYGVPTLW